MAQVNMVLTEADFFRGTDTCMLSMTANHFVRVTSRFYKNDRLRLATIKFQNETGADVGHHEINHKWKFQRSIVDPLAIYLGCYIPDPGKQKIDFLLKFGSEIGAEDFFHAFNDCIDFTEQDNEEKIERNVEYRLESMDLEQPDQPFPVVQGITLDAMMELLNSDIKAPKQNYCIFPEPGKICNFTCNVTTGIPQNELFDYFVEHVNDALKPHWRGCPGILNNPAMTRMVQGDPILNAEVYGFRTPGINRRLFEHAVQNDANASPPNELDPMANL